MSLRPRYGPAHCGEALRAYLATPGLRRRLVNLPGDGPNFNADEAIWNWVRQEATAILCLGVKALMNEKVSDFSPNSTAGAMGSNGDAAPCFRRGWKNSVASPKPILIASQM